MKTGIITHNGVNYWAEINRDKKAVSNYNHFVWLYRDGDKSPILGRSVKSTEGLIHTINGMIESHLKETSKTLEEILS